MADIDDSKSSDTKLQLFQSVQRTFPTLGIYSPEPFNDFRRFNLKNSIVGICFAVASATTGTYLFRESRTLSEYAHAAYGFSSATSIFVLYVVFVWNSESVFKLIGNFEKTVQNRLKHPASRILYETTNEMIEKRTQRIHFVCTTLLPAGFLLPNLITVTIAYFTQEKLDDGIFRLAYPSWFPFNWKSFPIGYSMAFCIEYVYFIHLYHIISFILNVFIGSYMLLKTVTKDMRQEFESLSDTLKSSQHRAENLNQFYETIQLHADASLILKDLNNIYEFIFLDSFVWGLSTICGSLLILQADLSRGKFNFDVIEIAVNALYTFGFIYSICEVSMEVTLHFEGVDNSIRETAWYSFPINVQRMLPTVILMAIKPAGIVAYGNIVLNRETFKRIVNLGFSSYMIFREF